MWSKYFKEGYRVFCPSKVIIYHLWSRDHRPSFREEKVSTNDGEIKDIDPSYLKIDSEESKKEKKEFWLKEIEKSITKEFQLHIGIDFEKKEISEKAKIGGFQSPEFLL
jgi:[Skp1-protein]-hydroxyproline N-acetylglucosaminyltransferase